MSNAFMASAEKSKREQVTIQSGHDDDDEIKVINVRVPASLRYKANLHRLETGENVTQLVCRLLRQELGD